MQTSSTHNLACESPPQDPGSVPVRLLFPKFMLVNCSNHTWRLGDFICASFVSEHVCMKATFWLLPVTGFQTLSTSAGAFHWRVASLCAATTWCCACLSTDFIMCTSTADLPVNSHSKILAGCQWWRYWKGQCCATEEDHTCWIETLRHVWKHVTLDDRGQQSQRQSTANAYIPGSCCWTCPAPFLSAGCQIVAGPQTVT